MGDLQEQIENMILLVEGADRKVREGVIVDMNSLESDVAALCARVTQSDPVLARAVQPLMADLITRLDQLVVSLDDFKTQHTKR